MQPYRQKIEELNRKVDNQSNELIIADFKNDSYRNILETNSNKIIIPNLQLNKGYYNYFRYVFKNFPLSFTVTYKLFITYYYEQYPETILYGFDNWGWIQENEDLILQMYNFQNTYNYILTLNFYRLGTMYEIQNWQK